MTLQRPDDLFNREDDWAALADFVEDLSPGIRVAIVYGRRRQGKSHLLRRLAKATDGLYHQALEHEPAQALRELGTQIGTYMGIGAPLALDNWAAAIGSLATPHAGSPDWKQGEPVVVVLDEFPYLVERSPELPSIVQRIVDNSQDGQMSPTRLILCGSAMTVMASLLEGQGPLRGRVHTTEIIEAFDPATAAAFWKITNPHLAFLVHAVVGGTPAYRELVRRAPKSVKDFEPWLFSEVLNPRSALYREDEWLLGEQSDLTGRSAYLSVLSAIAAGNTQQRDIASAVGRSANSIQHQLERLERIGFVSKDDDVLRERRPTYRIADPIVRFHHVVRHPRAALFDDGATELAWQQAHEGFQAHVLGPHFEALSRSFLKRHAEELIGTPAVAVGMTVMNDRAGIAEHELDIVVLGPGSGKKRKIITALGEAKLQTLDLSHLGRLEEIREKLDGQTNVRAADAKLVLASEKGFDAKLRTAAAKRADVVLLSVNEMFARNTERG
jgi:AAA+ ATPase superfamily predicted ATPase